MKNKKYHQFAAGTPAGTDLILFGDPATGELNKVTLASLFSQAFAVEYSTEEQVWPFERDINGDPMYWRTWFFPDGNNDYNQLTGLPVTDRTIWRGVHRSDSVPGESVTPGAPEFHKNTDDDVYEVALSAESINHYITAWYSKTELLLP